jgi:hypothetical protein
MRSEAYMSFARNTLEIFIALLKCTIFLEVTSCGFVAVSQRFVERRVKQQSSTLEITTISSSETYVNYQTTWRTHPRI